MNMDKNESFTFIDLFAGIGGFHQAMKQMGGKCVFAAEINPETAETYKKNYAIVLFTRQFMLICSQLAKTLRKKP